MIYNNRSNYHPGSVTGSFDIGIFSSPNKYQAAMELSRSETTHVLNLIYSLLQGAAIDDPSRKPVANAGIISAGNAAFGDVLAKCFVASLTEIILQKLKLRLQKEADLENYINNLVDDSLRKLISSSVQAKLLED